LSDSILDILKQFSSDPIAAFGPSLETGNPDPKTKFIHAHPADIIEKGEVNEVPWILGFNSDEGYEHTLCKIPLFYQFIFLELIHFYFTAIFKHENILQELNENVEKLFPITLEYVNESEEEQKEITQKIREFYFKNEKICEATKQNLSNVK
jgi:hypothetical protein